MKNFEFVLKRQLWIVNVRVPGGGRSKVMGHKSGQRKDGGGGKYLVTA